MSGQEHQHDAYSLRMADDARGVEIATRDPHAREGTSETT